MTTKLHHRFTALLTNRKLAVGALILIIVLTLPFVVFAAPQTVGADNSYVVVSSSMSPTIHASDAIIVEDVSPSTIEEGDIIVFEETGPLAGDNNINVVTHRVVDVMQTEDGLAYRTKGDALEEVDAQPVPQSALIGRVSFVIPNVGHVVQFAQSGTGFIFLVVVPFGLLVLNELWNLGMMLRGTGESGDSPAEGPDPPPETEPAEQ